MIKFFALSALAGLAASCSMTQPTDQTVAAPSSPNPNPYGVPGANPYGVPGQQSQGEVGQYTPVNPPYQGSDTPVPNSAPQPRYQTIPGASADGGGGEAIPRTHTVAKGDSLWGISRKYGVSVASLRKANGFTDGDSLIRPGQTLFIP